MSSVEIYHRQAKIGTEIFRRNFFILADLSGVLFWQADPQANAKSGEIKIWIQHADTNPRILTVLPDWYLVVDGIQFDSELYDAVEDLKGKEIELRHKEYIFKFRFPQ